MDDRDSRGEDLIDRDAPRSEATGDLRERFVKEGYGAAWTMRSADLDGNGTKELLYGGQGVVARGQNGEILWTFTLPKVDEGRVSDPGGRDRNNPIDDRQAGGGRARDPQVEDLSRDKQDGKDPSDRGGRSDDLGANEEEAAQKLKFMGLHVRDLRSTEGTVLVLDSADRMHRLDAETGELIYTAPLEGDGHACDFALIDVDGDDVPDFFPSGGTSAYSGETGKEIWDADIDFTPTLVKGGNLDGKRGRELLLIGDTSASDKDPNVCASELNAIAAMHDGMELESKEDSARDTDKRGDDTSDPEKDRSELSGDRSKKASTLHVAAVDSKGSTVYTANPPEGEILTASIYDLDGDGRGEAILGMRDRVVALDTEGQVYQEFAIEGKARQILALDVDGDGQNDLLVHGADDSGSTLYAYKQDGEELWNAPLDARVYVLEAIDLDGDGTDELITGLGYASGETDTPDKAAMASTVAWTLAAEGPQELWRVETAVPARAISVVEAESARPPREERGMESRPSEGSRPEEAGNAAIVIASGDGQLYELSADTGETIDRWSAGGMNHAAGAGDLDGDGIAEVLTGDVYGNITALDHDGEPLFEGKLEGDGPAVVTGIKVAENEAGNPGMFVVTGFAWRGDDAGVLQAYDEKGDTLFSVTTEKGLAEAKFADLDGDGRNEIVVPYFGFRIGKEGGDDACGVMAYDLDGNLLWEKDVASCDISQIAVGDSDGDGSDEVAYGDLGREAPYHVALLEGDGTVRWDIESEADDAVWLAIIDNGVAFGGRSNQKDGHVTVLESQDGMERWRMDLAGGASNTPEMEDSPFGAFAGSLFGMKIDEKNGEYAGDLAFTTVAGDIMVIDGQNGEPLWTGSFSKERGTTDFIGGPLTYVPGNNGAPGLLVATGYDFENFGSQALAFDIESGKEVGSLPLDELVVGVSATSWGRDQSGVSITTMYDTYGLDIEMNEPGGGRRGGRDDERPRFGEDDGYGDDGYGDEEPSLD